MDKNELRKHLQAIRAQIADRSRKDKHIEEAAIQMARAYESVFIYVSMGSEAGTHGIIGRLLGEGKQVYVPYTMPDKTMHAHRFYGGELQCDRRGNIRSSGERQDGQADLIFVPILGYNTDCHRIGYGAGCYDRYFARFAAGYKIGLAYNEQQCAFDPLPTDIPLDGILTPDRFIRRKI